MYRRQDSRAVRALDFNVIIIIICSYDGEILVSSQFLLAILYHISASPTAQRCNTSLRICAVLNKADIWAQPVISGIPL